MLDEAVQTCRAMFTGDDVTFEGHHFALDHARNLPRPVQPGGPRIMIGPGVRSGLPVAVAAEYADQCNVTGDAATLAHKIEVLHRHCAEVGRDPGRDQERLNGIAASSPSEQNTREVQEC